MLLDEEEGTKRKREKESLAELVEYHLQGWAISYINLDHRLTARTVDA